MLWGAPYGTWMSSGWTPLHGRAFVVILLIVVIICTVAIVRTLVPREGDREQQPGHSPSRDAPEQRHAAHAIRRAGKPRGKRTLGD